MRLGGDGQKREGDNGVKAVEKWIPHPLYAVLQPELPSHCLLLPEKFLQGF